MVEHNTILAELSPLSDKERLTRQGAIDRDCDQGHAFCHGKWRPYSGLSHRNTADLAEARSCNTLVASSAGEAFCVRARDLNFTSDKRREPCQSSLCSEIGRASSRERV